MGLVAEKGLSWLSAANEEMEGSENRPLQNESRRIEQVSRYPERVRLAVVVLVGGSDAKFGSQGKA
jgi:hypothetical protein